MRSLTPSIGLPALDPRARTRLVAALGCALLLAPALLGPVALAQGPPSRIEIRRGDEVVYATPEPEGAVRVLFVGNSLTYFNEVPWLFQQVVESKRPAPPVVTRFAGRSGINLERQWLREETRRLLRTERWDYVVLQEQSTRPLLDPEAHRRSLALFAEEVRRRGARPVIFETWPRRAEIARHGELRSAYRRLERELGVPVAPVGTAWEAASLAGFDLYRDVVHSNLAGAYLTACVLAASLLDVDPRGAVHTFPVDFDEVPPHRQSLAEERLGPETARRLQVLAWQAVQDR